MNNFFKQYEKLVYFCLVLSAALLVGLTFCFQQETIKALLLNIASNLFSVAILFFILEFSSKKKTEHQNEKISVVLTHGSKEFLLAAELRRAECTRAEVLGRLGMMKKNNGQRFSIAHLGTSTFFGHVNDIAEGVSTRLSIPCSEEELAQFDLPQN